LRFDAGFQFHRRSLAPILAGYLPRNTLTVT
jgi:hypothetical protein